MERKAIGRFQVVKLSSFERTLLNKVTFADMYI